MHVAYPGVMLPSFAALLAILGGCQNGYSGNGDRDVKAQSVSGVVSTSERPFAAEKSVPGLWLGDRAIPIATRSSSGEVIHTDGADDATRTWQVRAGDSVAGTIRRWADTAGYTPLPRFSTHEAWSFIVTQEFTGTFEDALIWLSNGFQKQPIKPVAVLYANRTLDLIDQQSAAVSAAMAMATAQDDHDGRK